MANFDTQLQRMKSLMTYGAVNENKKQVNGAMEYHAIGADGKAYGVIRENQKFYIKTADKKNEMVVEAYDYIGGFCNKKRYEYTMLSEAKRNLDMKLMTIKESFSPKTNSDINKFTVVSEEMSVCGKNMMNEIARARQIINNAAAIMNESSVIGCNNTGNPEAPKTTSFEPKAGPFTETATAALDKDMKASASDPKKQGEPFGDNAKTEESKDAEYVPQGSVANQKPKGGKVVKVDEATKKVWEMMAKLDKTFTLNESCEDAGTGSAEGHLMEDEEIAGIDDETVIDDAEFEGEGEDMSDVEGEDDFDFEMFDDDELEGEEDEEMSDEDSELEGEEEAEADMEAGEDDIDSLRDEIEALKARIAELEGGDEDVESEFEIEMDDDDFDDDMESEDEFGEEDFDDEEMDDEDFGDETPEEMEEEFDPEVDANYDDDDDKYEEKVLPESRKTMLEPLVENVVKMFINEEKLNDFGKHPGYRKKPMSLPATGSDEGDWNDESVYSEAPFGEEIGDSAPFDKVVSNITEKVFESFKKKI